ncbi:scavenger receptor class B member 1-like [Aricia agestis]|uniref:scavenger receptor class B member 1-like n=1 Tax=Aricia agestis TaxID=91739 RepID=UPI001C20C25C|nr:scavenger receptor class B member 1-like [Aricia agestis]
MYVKEPESGAGCIKCDTTDEGKESPYRLIHSDHSGTSTPERGHMANLVQRKSTSCRSITKTISVTLLIITSVLALIFPPMDFLLWEKLNMRPGLPPFDWWADPPDKVKMRVHVFNVTNHERFLAGVDTKLDVNEVGPIVYLEKLTHSNFRFNDNDTLTYFADRQLVFLPDDNHIDLNDTIIVPNIGVLGLLSYLYDGNYFVRTAIKLLIRQQGSSLFVRKTIYEYLWDFREPVVELSGRLAPGMLPVTNLGILNVIYFDFADEVTVKIGPRWGHKNFFRIDKVRGVPQMALYNPDVCPDRLTGSTEGVMYPQYLTKLDVLLYLRKSVCKIMPLYFVEEAVMEGVPVYRYNLTENVFDRITNGTDCYAGAPAHPFPDGISDASKCYYNFPLVASYPHFYTGSPPKDTYVTGLKPDRSKHSSYVYVEPKTGVPFESVARMQCNLYINDMSSYGDEELNKFSKLVLPLSWIEYKQEGLPNHFVYSIYFMVVILPPLAKVVCSLTLIVTSLLILNKIFKKTIIRSMFKKRKVEDLENNTIRVYEKEMFLQDSK